MADELLNWIEKKLGKHIHNHKLWNTYPLIFKCRCGHEKKDLLQ